MLYGILGAVERFGLGTLSAFYALPRGEQMYLIAYDRLRDRETKEAQEG